MTTETVANAADIRERFSEFVDRIDFGRVLIQKYGKDRAYLISVRELRALEETMAILENGPLMEAISRGIEDINSGRVRDADDVFAEIDAELLDGE